MSGGCIIFQVASLLLEVAQVHLPYCVEAGHNKTAKAIIDHDRKEEGTTKEETKIYMQVSR